MKETLINNDQENKRGLETHASNAALMQTEAMRKEIEAKVRENFSAENATPEKIDSVIDEVWRELKDMYSKCLDSDGQVEIQRSNNPLFVFLGLEVKPDPSKIEEINKQILN